MILARHVRHGDDIIFSDVDPAFSIKNAPLLQRQQCPGFGMQLPHISLTEALALRRTSRTRVISLIDSRSNRLISSMERDSSRNEMAEYASFNQSL